MVMSEQSGDLLVFTVRSPWLPPNESALLATVTGSETSSGYFHVVCRNVFEVNASKPERHGFVSPLV